MPSVRQSWVASANGHADFPLQNLPFGVFRRAGTSETPRVGVAIGDDILDIPACVAAELFKAFGDDVQHAARACVSPSLNALMGLGAASRRALRDALTALLASDVDENARQIEQYALVAQSSAELFLPVEVGDYTDFYASVHHATNVGSMFRPDNPLLPNYK